MQFEQHYTGKEHGYRGGFDFQIILQQTKINVEKKPNIQNFNCKCLNLISQGTFLVYFCTGALQLQQVVDVHFHPKRCSFFKKHFYKRHLQNCPWNFIIIIIIITSSFLVRQDFPISNCNKQHFSSSPPLFF